MLIKLKELKEYILYRNILSNRKIKMNKVNDDPIF